MLVMAIVEARSPLQYTTLPAGGVDIAAWSFREASTPEPARPRLLDRFRQALRASHLSRRTEEAYVVAASTQNQALSGLLFLYRDVLEIDLP